MLINCLVNWQNTVNANCIIIYRYSQFIFKLLGKSKFKAISKKTWKWVKMWYYHRLVLAILHKLPTIDFFCCFIQDDGVLKLFSTFTSDDQLLTNLLLMKKVFVKIFLQCMIYIKLMLQNVNIWITFLKLFECSSLMPSEYFLPNPQRRKKLGQQNFWIEFYLFLTAPAEFLLVHHWCKHYAVHRNHAAQSMRLL